MTEQQAVVAAPTDDDRVDIVEGWVRSKLPRLVAALGPLIAAAVTALVAWLQNAVGIDLQKHEAAFATFIGLVLLGALSFGVTWLFNSGRGQIAIAAKYAEALVEEGKAAGAYDPALGWRPEDDMVDPDTGTEDHIGVDPVAPPEAPGPLE
jgi:hypothetical protein